MGKKKSRPKKLKPLLSLQGILHLQNSFVQPSQESGLLSTVGGQTEQALVLAPNYGYGIPASTLQTNNNNEHEGSTYPGINTATEGKTGVIVDDSCQSSSSAKENDGNPDDLSVAELVRQIGGAKGKPLRRRDVVEDRENILNEQAQSHDIEESLEEMKDDIQADEFYASIGMLPPEKPVRIEEQANLNNKAEINSVQSMARIVDLNTADSPAMPTIDENIPESIADYYKSLNNYYYSAVPDPFSDDRIEFGSSITSTAYYPDSDTRIIELARIAQKRKRAMDAAMSAAHDTKSKTKKTNTESGGGASTQDKEPENYDPLPMEIIISESTAPLNITAQTGLKQYWDYVKENPHDFNRWTYLIHYVEHLRNLNECRLVYSSFLPLFPYCFGYWKRYCELEKGHHYFQRALTILQRGLDFNPLCVDLWLSYLNLFCEIYAHNTDFENIVREQYEKALSSAGMDFRSDALWDAFIQWELNHKRLKKVFTLYLRLIQVPTRLYNRHWDNVQELVRDHHPRDLLDTDYYEKLRKKGCGILKFKYKPEPEIEQGEIRKTSKPEDELMDYVKSKVLERLTVKHQNTALETDKRWDFEDLIRRPYFHVKALDKRQLHNWEAYLNFEIREGNHDRIILLFERCLTACAQYESFWCRYSRYVENYHKENKNMTPNISVHLQKSQINVEIVSKKQTDEEEALISDVESVLNNILSELEEKEAFESNEIRMTLEYIISKVCKLEGRSEINCNIQTVKLDLVISDVVAFDAMDSSKQLPGYLSGHSGEASELPPKSVEQNINSESASSSGLTSLISLPTFPSAKIYWQEIVRDIYKRACVIHCARKPACRLQWSAFEEEIGNIDEARQLILHLLEWFPNHLEAKMQLVELERRRQNFDIVEATFDEYLKKAKSNKEFSTLAVKYARFLAKEVAKPEKALVILRKAVKKDKGNPRIYSHIYELCYERFPTDKKGPIAALQIAINCKDLTNEQRLIFAKKMVHFFQEHGDLKRYRDAVDQLYDFQGIVQRDREEEAKLKAYDVPNMLNVLEPFPVPDWSSVLENGNMNASSSIPIQFEPLNEPVKPDVASEAADLAYKKVAPTRELLVGSEYGYGSRHPDNKLHEQVSQVEYEKLEAKGYAEHLLDENSDQDKVPKKRTHDSSLPLYIVAPKGSYLMSYLGGPNTAENPPVPGDAKRIKLDAPIELKMLPMPQESPCINVPDWFVKEGGELCLSETPRGFSIIRYWPHFLSETGNRKMFRSIRKCVKWHQKQNLVGGRWRHLSRLVSWLGPCDYLNNGLAMPRNENWPPEVLDLLHRLIQMTRHEFNSCFLNLYRTGHDNIGWHSDSIAALGTNPPIGSVSLGALRLFELRRRGPVHNFIRFPLFPGSLLIMEGATQEDWSHQIPKEPTVKEERVNLTFRVMHAIDDVEKIPGYKPVQPKPVIPEATISEVNSVTPNTSTETTINTSGISSTTKVDGPLESQGSKPKDLETRNKSEQSTKIIFHKKILETEK